MNTLGAVGVAFLAFAGWLILDVVFLIRRCKGTAIGTLVQIEETNDYNPYINRTHCYLPVYAYEVGGKEYRNVARIYKTNPEEYELGSTIEVKYCETNPNVCIIGNRNGKVGCGIILIILGLFACFFGWWI